MIQDRLNIAKETFESIYGFNPNFELTSSGTVQVLDNGNKTNMGVFNILSLKDGRYKFTAMSDQLNDNHKGEAIVKDGAITLHTNNGKFIVNQWCIEEFKVNGEIKYYPIAMWGEYPILVEL